jgi:transcriptional regulator with XRE-family HTH domain
MNLSYIRSNIKKLRRTKGTTQREMALRLYMDERTYAKIERGVNKSMDIRLLSAIADILETDVSTLLQNPISVASEMAQDNSWKSPEPEKAPAKSNVSHDENVSLLQEILSLKEEVRALMEFQKRAMRLLRS